MPNLILTAVEGTDAATEAFNLIEWVGENPAFVNACIALLGIVVGAVCFLATKRKRK